jgi:hypothetical protein
MIYGEQDRRSFAEANGSNQVAAEANELADAFRAYRMKRWGRTTMEAQLDRATLTPIDELRRAAQETPAEPVAGVMPGSDLERQIQSARATIADWPDDVKRAMGVELETRPVPDDRWIKHSEETAVEPSMHRSQVIARARMAHGGKWPEELTSGVMFYEGLRVTRDDFEHR